MALPSLKNHAFAAHHTFVKPITDAVKWRIGQFSPKSIGYDILRSDGLGRAALDYKWNFDFSKNPFAGGFDNPINTQPSAPMGAISGPLGDNDNGGVSRVIVESFNNGFSNMVRELQNIRQTVGALGKLATNSSKSTETTSSKLTELVEFMKSKFSRNKFSDAEANLEKQSDSIQNETGNIEQESTGFFGKLFGSVFNFLKSKTAWLAGLGLLFKDKIIDIVKFIFSKFGDIIKGIKLPDVGRVFEPIGKSIKKFFTLFEDVGKILEPAIKVAEKAIPALKLLPKFFGPLATVLFALIDGVKGFVEEFNEADGNMFQKVIAGFGGAIKGVIKGILELPKMLLLGVKKLSEVVLDLIGFKDLSKQLKDFKLGDKIDSFIDSVFTTIVKMFKPENNLLTSLGKFVVDAFKMLITKFIPGGAALAKLIPSFGEDYTKSEERNEESTPSNFLDKLAENIGSSWQRMGESVRNVGTRAWETTKSAGQNAARVTQDITMELNEKARAFLATITDKEAPDYNTLNGGEKFTDMSWHPERRGRGGTSTAAGRYQFVKDTWNAQAKKLGLTDFSPESQDKAAWNLAQEDYRRNTRGRSLAADLEAGTVNWSALKTTWSSLPGGVEQTTSTSDVNKRYAAHLSREEARSKPATQTTSQNKGAMSAAELQQMYYGQNLLGASSAFNNTNNISAPTVINNNVAPQKLPKPPTDTKRYNDQGPRP